MKNTINNKSGFTLLEIIIVIIIVGVLASLALPKFFQTVEFSKSTEALSTVGTLRQALERCYLQLDPSTYVGCIITNLDVANPSYPGNPSSIFTYSIAAQTATGYVITAARSGVPPFPAGSIIVTQATAGVTRTGTGSFVGIK